MGVFSFLKDRLRIFNNIIVHPSQEMFYPLGTFFRGGPEWPFFDAQILARHCWGAIPKAIDFQPHPAEPEWPYFDRRRYANPEFAQQHRWRAILRLPDGRPQIASQSFATADTGIWCGPICDHFGMMIADFGMRIAASSRLDASTPLVFSLWPFDEAEPPPFFWRIIEHLQIDRARVMLIRKPTRFARLWVLPQAERRDGGAPSPRHLRLMDAITGSTSPPDRDLPCVFISRSRMQRGNFAGEAYLDETFAAAGVSVFHPETADLLTQLQLYRRARHLIFSEGSALHALQLLGHLDADIVILARRPRYRMAAASLRPRARSLRYLHPALGLVHGLTASGGPHPSRGISVLDERRTIAGLASLGIDVAPFWDPKTYAERRDADIAAWVDQRLAAAAHPGERAFIEKRLRELSLGP